MSHTSHLACKSDKLFINSACKPKLFKGAGMAPIKDGGCKDDRPFGPIAHGDGDAITRLNAQFVLQVRSDCVDGLKETIKGPAIVFINHEFHRPVCSASIDQVGQIGECIAVP